MSHEIFFEYKRGGNESGFKLPGLTEYVFKPDKYSAAIIKVETLTRNLRVMVRNKQARLIKAGTIEAVAVPSNLIMNLYYETRTT